MEHLPWDLERGFKICSTEYVEDVDGLEVREEDGDLACQKEM